MYIIGGSSNKTLNSCEYFDYSAKKWKAIATMKICREEHGVILGPDNKIYSIGGHDGKCCLGTVERYDPKINAWTFLSGLKTKRQGLCSVIQGNDIYAIGGRNSEKYLNSVEKYNLCSNEWKTVKEMNIPRAYASAVYVGGFIYVFGGHNGKPLNTVEKYDIAGNDWVFVSPMKIKRHMHCSVLYPKNIV